MTEQRTPTPSPFSWRSTITDGAGSSEQIEGRVKQIRAQIEESASDCDREKLRERVAKCSSPPAFRYFRLTAKTAECAT
jgi:hypothetical protein